MGSNKNSFEFDKKQTKTRIFTRSEILTDWKLAFSDFTENVYLTSRYFYVIYILRNDKPPPNHTDELRAIHLSSTSTARPRVPRSTSDPATKRATEGKNRNYQSAIAEIVRQSDTVMYVNVFAGYKCI